MRDDPTHTAWHEYLELRRALRALSDEVRIAIVRTLANGEEVKVTDLAASLVISQPLVSWHLGALRRSGLVVTNRRGREVYLSLNTARYQWVLRQLGALVDCEVNPPATPSTPPAASPLYPAPERH